MRKIRWITLLLLVVVLSGCGGTQTIYNFTPRQDSFMISGDEKVIVNYKTDIEGQMIELDVDRLLTIEEMMILNPVIDFEYELDGFTGDIFIEPSNTCTDISNDVLIPSNLEVGNTRYKYDDDDCMYKTVDNYNEFKPGFSREYHLTDTIPVASHVTISIIVYHPSELVSFIEIYDIPNTYKSMGSYNILINRDRNGFENDYANYYNDVTTFEQLYLKHQQLEGTLSEISGISTDVNLMDLDSLMDISPIIDNFENLYEVEIEAMQELQSEIGETFEIESEDIEDEDQNIEETE